MFGAVPSVELLLMPRVDVGVHQENSTPFLGHTAHSFPSISFSSASTFSRHPIYIDALPRDVARLVGGQEDDGCRRILRFADPPQRDAEAELRRIALQHLLLPCLD